MRSKIRIHGRVSLRGTGLTDLALIGMMLSIVPATAGSTDKQHRLVERSFHPLMNDPAYSGPPAVQVTAEDRVFAYVGTLFRTDHCHSTDHVDPSDRAGVVVIDITDPDAPEFKRVIPTTPGAQSKDVRVFSHTDSAGSRRDLLVVGLEGCLPKAAVQEASADEETDDPTTGFEVFDVTDPGEPKRVGKWVSGGRGVHNLSVFERRDLGGRVFVAATYLQTTDTVLADAALGNNIYDPSLKIVEITDPATPTVVGSWSLLDHPGSVCEPRGDYRHCQLHDVQLSHDGKKAYLAHWDAGVVVLDTEDVTSPTLVGQWLPPEDRCATGRVGETYEGHLCQMDADGATHTVVPLKRGGRDLVLVTAEEWKAPLQGFLRVVDVTDSDPNQWRQVGRYLTPHAGSSDAIYYAHQAWPGPTMPGGGEVYLSAHSDGLRVLSVEEAGTVIRETAWFVPGPDDHPDDVDQDPDPTGFFQDRAFEGSTTIRHPVSNDLLILVVDVKRGLYVLEPTTEEAGSGTHS